MILLGMCFVVFVYLRRFHTNDVLRHSPAHVSRLLDAEQPDHAASVADHPRRHSSTEIKTREKNVVISKPNQTKDSDLHTVSETTFGIILQKIFDMYKRQGVVPMIVKRMYDQYSNVTKGNVGIKKKTADGICDWKCLLENGFDVESADFGMLQWMLQSNTSTTVLFWPGAASDLAKMEVARDMVSRKCGQIIYEKQITVNQQGLASLAFHAYGQQSWLEAKVKHLYASVPRELQDQMAVLAMFVTPEKNTDLEKCKTDIRNYFALANPKSAVHIPDYHNEAIIVSEMVLNPNSVLFLNRHHGDACRHVTSELGHRLHLSEVRPGLYVLPQTIMVDSGSVMAFFGIRKADDVDLRFHGPVNKSILGKRNGVEMSAHTDRGSVDDLFLDPANHGYCHGVKFTSLQQLVRYKKRRGVPHKDDVDVANILKFLKSGTKE